ncbi:MAG: T9SS type A sorting domain-containing protein [Chitinophagaceae bacterium]|nr:T9SS type A sorting domain-containing protein [Chitinophagaceae bacterium]
MRTIFTLFACLSISASVFSQNLVAYYPFNGNNNDESGNSINPTYTGVGVTLTTDRFGNANKAYYFDGATDSYMRMPSDLLPTANRTVSFWFNAASVSIRPFMLGYGGNGGPPGTSFLMGLNASGCGCYHTQAHHNTNAVSYNYVTDPVNQWVHWVVTINGSTTKMYVNGSLVANVPGSFTSNTYVSGRDLAIGVMVNAAGIAPYTDINGSYFQGKLDDIRIYDNAMTDAQVQDLYTNETMVAYFPFNGNAIDETGNGNNSTYTGTGVTLTADRFGNANKAYYFDGAVGSYIRVPADNFPATDRTISFWFNADQLGYYIPTPFSYGGSNVCYNSLLMIINHHNYTNSYLVETHCGANIISAPYTLEPVNNWYHLTLTINGSTQKIFVNGVLQQSANSFTSPTYVTGTSALLGACINTDGNSVFDGYFQGKLDEFRIYNTALTDAQVLALHNDQAGAPPVAFYPFNGNANDESGNGYNGTVSGATLTTDRFNQPGKAFNFSWNGTSSDKIQVPGTSDMNFSTGGFSLSAWFRFAGPSNSGYNYPIISKHICGDNSGYIVMLYNDKLTFWLGGAGWYPGFLSTAESYVDDKWHQVTAVYNGTNRFIYVDGILKATDAVAYSITNTATIALGGYNGCNGGFNGKVDEIKVFDRPITAGEIQKMYNQSATDMVAYYPFNGNANDESGNDNNGVVTGASLTTDRFGNSNKAYNFNGANNFISVADNPDLFSDELTLSWWYKVPEYAGTRVVIGWVNGGNRYQQFFSNNSLAYFNGYCGGGGCGGFNPTYNNMTAVNQWQHVAVTYKKTNVNESVTSLYINGEWKQTDNHAAAITYQPGSTFFIGKTHDGGYFNGELDDIRVYSRTLSPNEILQLADVPILPDLLAYLPMNGNANDMSGNNHNGTVVNATAATDKYDNNNSAFQFNGNGSGTSITLANSNSLDFLGTPFTISTWVKFSSATGEPKMIAGKHNCGTPTGYFLGVYNNSLSYWLATGNSWSQLTTTETYNDDKWHHIVGTYDGVNQKLFVDGMFKAGTSTTYNTPASGAPIKVGEPSGGCGGLGVINGKVDELKIYSAALDVAQVMALYKQSRGSDKALKLDGVDDIVAIPNGGALNNLQTGTIDLWVKWNGINQDPGNFDTYGAIVARQSNAQFSNQIIALNGPDPNSANIIWKPYSSTSTSITSSLSPGNKWNHLAIVYSSGIHEMYLNGILVGSSIDAGTIADATVPLTLGGWIDHGNCFGNADLDEVRIWNVALSQTQIREWMNRKITAEHPAYSNLAGYYNFDELNLLQVYDAKSGKTGTMINGPASVISGAAIGDGSVYDFINTTRSATLTLSTGENFNATYSNGNMDGISVYVVKDPPVNLTGTLGVGANDHYFGVFVSGSGMPQYTAIYDYTGNAFVSPGDEPTLQLFKRDNNSSSPWINSGAILNTTLNTLSVSGQNTEYILGSSGFALPVTLLNFEIRKLNATTAQLSWKTATEINNKGFEVQRSFDGNSFTTVQFVNGAGYSSDRKEYNIMDIPGKTGRVYYRLKQIDFDGNSKLSNILSVLFDKQEIIKVYPNPAQQQVTVEGIENYSRLQVVDAAGKVLKDIYTNGHYLVNINLEGLKNGVYLLRMVNEKASQTIKLVISK